jgi:hypothetical protein
MSLFQRLHQEKAGKAGVVPYAVKATEVALASAGFGYVQNRFRSASVGPLPIDLAAGLGLSGLVAGAKFLGKGGDGALMTIAGRFGVAGLAAFAHTWGAGYGAQASGVRRLLVSAADLPKAKAALPNATILGDIPKAPHGDFLSSSDLASLSR